ncbi:MAG: hypothetical protein R3C03_12255 [Pirellulaceae bacterium]
MVSRTSNERPGQLRRRLGRQRLGGAKRGGKSFGGGELPRLSMLGMLVFGLGFLMTAVPMMTSEMSFFMRLMGVAGVGFLGLGCLLLLIGYISEGAATKGTVLTLPLIVFTVIVGLVWYFFPNGISPTATGMARLAEGPKEQVVAEGQQEYLAGYALTFGLVTLGVLVVSLPRMRANDLPENIERRERETLKRRTAALKRKN